ncbi:MAG: hypothetical protein OXM03_04480 [Chloroflexota bacterium]|nr:hypothetical protein [Caldilineaceae bacterium]MDE0455166.1 hypothetical protein [Gammaproteobacteria bacterium]MDE2839865.1 hypothetical protein [Chloroflexota bacterium]
MSRDNNRVLESKSRFERMREHLQIQPSPDNAAFEEAVIGACRDKIDELLADAAVRSGEDILDHVAASLQVRFEEVHDDEDIAELEQKYLKDKGEIGFGQLEIELNAPDVDAILFQRMRADRLDPDRWVAVLNLRESRSRAYWNRAHELIHRIAEPPQYRLPFYRHRNDKTNPLESLIDKGAAELAFYPRIFRPIVSSVSREIMSWDLVNHVREHFAPSASRLATAIAMLRHWPSETYMLKARIQGRKGSPRIDRALRISFQGHSPTTDKRVFFFPNMRVPATSPISKSYQCGHPISDIDDLGEWVTSNGSKLPAISSFTSVVPWRDSVFALASPI